MNTTVQTNSIKTVQYTLYTHWIPAWVNNDVSGLSNEEHDALERFCGYLMNTYDIAICVGVEDSGMFGKPDCGGPYGDVSLFTFQITR